MYREKNEDELVEFFLKLLEDSPIQLDELSPELANRAYTKAYHKNLELMNKRNERLKKGAPDRYTKHEKRSMERLNNITSGSTIADKDGKTYNKEKRDAKAKEHEAKYGPGWREHKEKKKAAELAAFREKQAKLIAKKKEKPMSSTNEKLTQEYVNYINEQVRKERLLGFRSVSESTNDHIMISHPIETLHAGDNKNRTGKSLTDRHGDFSKEYHNQEHHYKQILKKIGKSKDVKTHYGHEDEDGHISFKKGSAAHKAIQDHLQHVDHSSVSHKQHTSGPDA